MHFSAAAPGSTLPRTLGELRATGYQPRTVKDELRQNLMAALREGRPLFTGIVGFEKTVIPQIINAVLARHDIILLGLRGQAKTRIARQLADLLDEWSPILPGFPLNEDPLAPISATARQHVDAAGDETEIAWMHRADRYREKLATPDVSVSDLIGDIDPIKAANLKLDFSNERVIHFGIIPRTNRGIFCINELPDLTGRIQVSLLNIMQERDIQVRGFPIRLPLDVMMVFTANPEDYTNRGSIITPLKDRIESQVMTHYPRQLEHAMQITTQESWVERDSGVAVHVPRFLREAVEEVAFAARRSEYLDQSSGVSARLPISLLEAVVSNAERRALITGESRMCVRPIDFHAGLSAVTGKVELVYQGEQEGPTNVGRHLIGMGLKAVFDRLLPDVNQSQTDASGAEDVLGAYKPIVNYFSNGNRVQLTDAEPPDQTRSKLRAIDGLESLTLQHVTLDDNDLELVAAMEFVLEGLHQARLVGKEDLDGEINFYDMLGDLLEGVDTDR